MPPISLSSLVYQIIEAMPQTDEVRNFLRVMGPFFEMVTVTEDGKVQNGGIPNRNVAHLPNGEHNGAVDGGLPQIVSKVNGTDTEIDKDGTYSNQCTRLTSHFLSCLW